MRRIKQWDADITADVLTNILQPGRFAQLDQNLTIRIRERQPELVNRSQTAQLLSRAAQRHNGELQALGGRATTIVRFRVNVDGSADPSSKVRSPPIRSQITPDNRRLTMPKASMIASICAPRATP